MRDFRLQMMLDFFRSLIKKEINLIELFGYVSCWFGIKKGKIQANKMFDRRDFSNLRKLIFRLGKQDPAWFPRLMEPFTRGIRAWEYGLLLSLITFRGKKVLDVGCGNSRLPSYLASKGARVIMLDKNMPLEETKIKRKKGLRFIEGDMTNLQFGDSVFDRVLCISALEHVDMKDSGFFERNEYEQRAISSIKEMCRVLKKGGVLYLTTDFYLDQQKTDNWPGSVSQIRGAFRFDMAKQFQITLENSGVRLRPPVDIDQNSLLIDRRRANYRGRYFTTIAFMGVKI